MLTVYRHLKFQCVSSVWHRPSDWVERQQHIVDGVHNGCAAGPQVWRDNVCRAPHALHLHTYVMMRML